MKQLGLVPTDAELPPAPEPWAAVPEKAWEVRCMEVYAAMVETMDAGIGRVVAELRSTGQLENPLILYLQDNGACAETNGRADNGNPPGVLRPMGPGQLQPRMGPPMQTRDGRWVKSGPKVLPGPADSYVAYGRGWANVSNTPFREYKHRTHEGGISTPLIAHWPAGIRGDRAGSLERRPGHLIDLMATCVDVAGATYPSEVAGRAIKPREGVSLRPAIDGQPLARTHPLFWEHEGNRAVREGDWKLVAREGGPWELYRVDADRVEGRDLAAREPSRVQHLAALWDADAARADVLPLGAWRPPDEPRAVAAVGRRRFELKAGDHLDRTDAPAVSGRPFTVEARFEAGQLGEGVIVAQGGPANGFSLYLEAGRPHFAVRRDEVLAEVEGPPLSPGGHTATAGLDESGAPTLVVDGKAVAAPVAGTFLTRMPVDGLDVGRDGNAPVGPYNSPRAFTGTVQSVVIQVGG